MKRVQQGFTLIELMIVVAIIGILAAVAIPQYQNYVIKSRIANVMSSVDSLKTAVAVCIQENGGIATNCTTGGANVEIPAFTPTAEVTTATVTAGVITATLRDAVGAGTGAQIVFTPAPNPAGTAVTWATAGVSVTNAAVTTLLAKNNVPTAAAPGPAPAPAPATPPAAP